jgi:hypothetical protein
MTLIESKPRDGWLWITLAASASVFVLTGCSRGVRPDDMSAAAHRQEASKERVAADEHRRQYDPHAVATMPPSRAEPAPVVVAGNPTEVHLQAANAHERHAREHEQAAAELDAFEASECAEVEHSHRAACPVLIGVKQVVDIKGGVRVELRHAADVPEMLGRMRCHLAFARTRGYERAADCPLYVRGVDIRAAADGKAIEITGATRALIDEIRGRFGRAP